MAKQRHDPGVKKRRARELRKRKGTRTRPRPWATDRDGYKK